jgi:hypothetical protein
VNLDDVEPVRLVLRVVRGEPTPEELAALVAVLGARAGAHIPPAAPRSAWSDPCQLVRKYLPHGPGQWVRSSRPV